MALHKKYRDRMNKLADFLSTLPRRKFRMEDWVSEADDHKCGTVCCAVGWAPAVFPRHWKWGRIDARVFPELRSARGLSYPAQDVENFFGVPPDGVFYPRGIPGGKDSDPQDGCQATPQTCLHVILKFLLTPRRGQRRAVVFICSQSVRTSGPEEESYVPGLSTFWFRYLRVDRGHRPLPG